MLKRFAILSALVVGTASFAHATTLSQISIGGNDTWQVSGNSGTIVFYNPAYVTPGATGNFAFFTAGDNNVVLFPAYASTNPPAPGCSTTLTCNPTQPLPFSLGQQTVQQRLGVPSVLALATTYTVGTTTETLDFYMTDYSVSEVSGVSGCQQLYCLDVNANGYFTETGYANMPGSFTFTTQAADTIGDTEVSLSATGTETTPEPTSLVLLGTGLLGTVGIARRRYVRAA